MRDLVHPQQLGSGILIGHQGANNTRLSTRSMRQSPHLIQQSYLDVICPYSTELGLREEGVHLPEVSKGHAIVKPSTGMQEDYMIIGSVLQFRWAPSQLVLITEAVDLKHL